jgi:8-oxo-dGTP diphosphatase
MSMHRNTVIPAVFLLLQRGNDVLLQRRFNTGFQDGNYTLISGHVDAGESPTQALSREAKEEAGITVNEKDLHFIQVLYRRGFDNIKAEFNKDQTERVDFFFSTTRWSGEPHITEPDKCDDLQWFSLDNLPENIFPIVKTFLEELKNKNPYKESGY